MIHDYIKQEIPAAINEGGGASVKLVNKRTVPLDTSIKEALAGNYVISSEQLLRANFTGLVKSMAEGVQRDGHARQLGNFLTLYAQPNGVFDLDKGWDPAVNSVSLKARLLNEMEIDISNWTFRDVTPGKQTFALDSVSTGTDVGVVKMREDIHLNCRDLPGKSALRVSWVCGDKSGDVEAAKFTSDVTRIDVDKSVLSSIWSEAYDGKEITFIVRGCFSTAKKTAKVKYAPAPVVAPTMTEVHPIDHPTETNKIRCFEEANILTGTGLNGVTAVKYAWEQNPGEILTGTGEITEKTATTLKFTMEEVQFNAAGHLIVTWSGGDVTSTFTVEAKEPEEP